jgi:hypothetical protein
MLIGTVKLSATVTDIVCPSGYLESIHWRQKMYKFVGSRLSHAFVSRSTVPVPTLISYSKVISKELPYLIVSDPHSIYADPDPGLKLANFFQCEILLCINNSSNKYTFKQFIQTSLSKILLSNTILTFYDEFSVFGLRFSLSFCWFYT